MITTPAAITVGFEIQNFWAKFAYGGGGGGTSVDFRFFDGGGFVGQMGFAGESLGFWDWAFTTPKWDYLVVIPGSGGWVSVASVSLDLGGAGGGVIPEPATWAMLIAGFGMVGAAARRRSVRIVSV